MGKGDIMKTVFTLLTFLSLLSTDFAHAKNNCASAAEKKCLADTINGEARNQGYEGMKIVAKAVMTRLARGKYGSSICKITDGASFHRDSRRPTKGGPIDTRANSNVKKATELGCTFGDMGITHFYKKGSKKPAWANKFPRANPASHGNHYLFNAPMYVEADFENENWEDLLEPLIHNNNYDDEENESDETEGGIII